MYVNVHGPLPHLRCHCRFALESLMFMPRHPTGHRATYSGGKGS
jgi:hypothetical protein